MAIHSFSGIHLSNKKEWPATRNNMHEIQNDFARWKETHSKEHILYDSIHMAFSKGKNYRLSLQGLGVGGGKLATKGHDKTFWDNGNILHLNVVNFIYYRRLSKFIELYTKKWWVLLYINYISKNACCNIDTFSSEKGNLKMIDFLKLTLALSSQMKE